MPEFEENQTKPELNNDQNQYQPGQGKATPQSSQTNTYGTQTSKLGSRKRSTRGPKPTFIEKESQQESLHSSHEAPSIDEEPFTYDEEEPTIPKHDPSSRSQQQKIHKTPTKPISRKDVFIPKTKQESERHKSRHPSIGSKKTSLWQRILAFFGLGSKPKQTTRKHKDDHTHEKSSRPHTSSFQKKRYSQPRKYSGQRSSAHKSPGKQGPKSGF